MKLKSVSVRESTRRGLMRLLEEKILQALRADRDRGSRFHSWHDAGSVRYLLRRSRPPEATLGKVSAALTRLADEGRIDRKRPDRPRRVG